MRPVSRSCLADRHPRGKRLSKHSHWLRRRPTAAGPATAVPRTPRCTSPLPYFFPGLCTNFFVGGFRPRRTGEARSPEGTPEISRNQRSELSNATIVPQSNAVADITRREDELNLIPGNAAGTATPVGTPTCPWHSQAYVQAIGVLQRGTPGAGYRTFNCRFVHRSGHVWGPGGSTTTDWSISTGALTAARGRYVRRARTF